MSSTTDDPEETPVWFSVGPNGCGQGSFRYHTDRECRALRQATRNVRCKPPRELDDRYELCKFCSGEAESPTQGDQSAWKLLREIGEASAPEKDGRYK